MDVGSFQYVTSLLQFSAALNLGFVISEGFRNLPKRQFEQQTQQWLKLQAAEKRTRGSGAAKPTLTESRILEYIGESQAKGAIEELKEVWWKRFWGIGSFAYSSILSLLPLPFFFANDGHLAWLYGISVVVAVYPLLSLMYTYHH
jgi:hypothetical protein